MKKIIISILMLILAYDVKAEYTERLIAIVNNDIVMTRELNKHTKSLKALCRTERYYIKLLPLVKNYSKVRLQLEKVKEKKIVIKEKHVKKTYYSIIKKATNKYENRKKFKTVLLKGTKYAFFTNAGKKFLTDITYINKLYAKILYRKLVSNEKDVYDSTKISNYGLRSGFDWCKVVIIRFRKQKDNASKINYIINNINKYDQPIFNKFLEENKIQKYIHNMQMGTRFKVSAYVHKYKNGFDTDIVGPMTFKHRIYIVKVLNEFRPKMFNEMRKLYNSHKKHIIYNFMTTHCFRRYSEEEEKYIENQYEEHYYDNDDWFYYKKNKNSCEEHIKNIKKKK